MRLATTEDAVSDHPFGPPRDSLNGKGNFQCPMLIIVSKSCVRYDVHVVLVSAEERVNDNVI